MLTDSKGIVLSTLRYSDSSVIARIYTQTNGQRSFMVRIGKGKNALPKLALLQPLSLVEVSFTEDERKNLHTLHSIERECTVKNIPFDPLKTGIALFVSELIGSSIKEQERNNELFHFLHTSVVLLDDATGSAANFHLKFMIELTRFLGFYPGAMPKPLPYFDLSEGNFTATLPLHRHHLSQPLTEKFDALIRAGMTSFATVQLTNTQRRELLQHLIDYYRLHLDGMREIKAHSVLEAVLS